MKGATGNTAIDVTCASQLFQTLFSLNLLGFIACKDARLPIIGIFKGPFSHHFRYCTNAVP
jgi:hypothetical protein